MGGGDFDGIRVYLDEKTVLHNIRRKSDKNNKILTPRAMPRGMCYWHFMPYTQSISKVKKLLV